MQLDQYEALIEAMSKNRMDQQTFTTEQILNMVDDHFNRVLNHIKANSQEYGEYRYHIEQTINALEALWFHLGNSIHKLHEDRKQVADSKRGDYTRGDSDVFANFKNQSKALGLRPEQCLAVHMEKQFSAVVNYINTDGESESEPIIKRFGDTMNYLELLYGLVEEKSQEDGSPLVFESICVGGEEFKAEDLASDNIMIHEGNQDEDKVAGFGNKSRFRPCDKCLSPSACNSVGCQYNE